MSQCAIQVLARGSARLRRKYNEIDADRVKQDARRAPAKSERKPDHEPDGPHIAAFGTRHPFLAHNFNPAPVAGWLRAIPDNTLLPDTAHSKRISPPGENVYLANISSPGRAG